MEGRGIMIGFWGNCFSSDFSILSEWSVCGIMARNSDSQSRIHLTWPDPLLFVHAEIFLENFKNHLHDVVVCLFDKLYRYWSALYACIHSCLPQLHWSCLSQSVAVCSSSGQSCATTESRYFIRAMFSSVHPLPLSITSQHHVADNEQILVEGVFV